MTSYGKPIRIQRTREPVLAFHELKLKADATKMSSIYAQSLAAELTLIPGYKKKYKNKKIMSVMTKLHADFVATYCLTVDKLIAPIDTDPSACFAEDDWEPLSSQKLPGPSGSAPITQVLGGPDHFKKGSSSKHSKHKSAPFMNDDWEPQRLPGSSGYNPLLQNSGHHQSSKPKAVTKTSKHGHLSSKHSKKQTKNENLDGSAEPWPQIRFFISSKRDLNWKSVYKLVTLFPEDFTDREKDLRQQATHIVYSWKKKQFQCIWDELKVEENLDDVLKTIDKMTSSYEASSAWGMLTPHEGKPTDVQRVCDAMMRGTFFRNNGSIVFHKRLFHNYLNGQPEEVDKME